MHGWLMRGDIFPTLRTASCALCTSFTEHFFHYTLPTFLTLQPQCLFQIFLTDRFLGSGGHVLDHNLVLFQLLGAEQQTGLDPELVGLAQEALDALGLKTDL